VAVCGANPVSRSLTQQMLDWQARRQRRSALVPILPAGASVGTSLPGVDKYVALFNTGFIEMLAPDVLRAAGIGGPDHRLFVSYRREDAQDLAEQLADAFEHAGFQVFLDRFSGALGRPFPRLLAEELADKGMLLVLESPLVRSSRWTLREVAFARVLHLGLFALALPHGSAFKEIRGGDRHVPDAGDWSAPGPRGPKLTGQACGSVVDFVRERYAAQALARQLYLESLLHQCLATQGLAAVALGGTTFRVAAGADYLVQLSSRPPRLAELRRASSAAQPLAAHPVIVGAHHFLPPQERSDIEWLATELRASLRQEGRLPRLAKALAAGQVPP
jgi:TIR domain